MGKDNLLIGTARGKLGDVVFYRTGGEQRFRTRVRPTNPRTDAQLIQRCVVSTVVKAYSNFVTVCDHAFQNFEGKLKNHQRYMRLNIMKFRPIAVAQVKRWSPIEWISTDNIKLQNWCKKDDTSTYVNPYILSEGDLPEIQINFKEVGTNKKAVFLRVKSNLTYANVVNTLGLNAGDQLTFVIQTADQTTGAVKQTRIGRVILMPASGDMNEKFLTQEVGTFQKINDPNPENYGDIIIGNIKVEDEGYDVFATSSYIQNEQIASIGIIVSRFENNMWRRSNSIMVVEDSYKNLSSLEAAVGSYLKSDTSSLYLNQSTTGERQELEEEVLTQIESEIDMYGEPITKEEKKTQKNKNREIPTAE